MVAHNVNKMAFSLACILAFAIALNSSALALPNDVDCSKASFKKVTSSQLNICAGVSMRKKICICISHNHLGKLIPNPGTFNYKFVPMK